MKESINIYNFACIDQAKVDFNKFTILIGPQATGKSIIAKLFYFFKKFPHYLIADEGETITKRKTDKNIIDLFEKYFPTKYLKDNDFSIEYKSGENFIKIYGKSPNHGERRIKIEYSDIYNNIRNDYKLFLRKINTKVEKSGEPEDIFRMESPEDRARQKIINKYRDFYDFSIFIPAGRSFFSNIENIIFSLLSKNQGIDPFLQEFGAFYETIKKRVTMATRRVRLKEIEVLQELILRGEFFQEKGRDFIRSKDGRIIGMENASSGQQEALPLYLMLNHLSRIMTRNPRTIFIEEPEAHLFPDAQNSLVETIVSIFNRRPNQYNFVITTHSPYILSTFNNLAFAGSVSSSENIQEIEKILGSRIVLKPSFLSAYSTQGKNVEKIICAETNLINAESIDSVSNKISKQFDSLMEFVER